MDALYARINKLLALANNDAATEAEAALAAEHVQRLLQEHNLTLTQVEASTGAAEKREKTATDRAAMYLWQRSLMAVLAENNFCLHQIKDVKVGKQTVRQHLLVGRAINVRVTIDTYDYLFAAIRRAAIEVGYPWTKRTREVHWFCEGATARLESRLRDRRREAEAAAPPAGNGTHCELVLADVYGTEADLNNDTLNGFPAGTTATRRLKQQQEEAVRKAKEADLIAAGVPADEAFYRSYGYDAAQASAAAVRWRRRSSRRGGRGRSQGWTNGDRAYYAKIGSDAYAAGKAAGDAVGLDPQVGTGSVKRLPGKIR